MKSLLDNLSMQSGERYVDLLNSFRNLLWNAMRQNPKDMRNRTYLKETALERARTFRETEQAMFDFSLENVVSQVQQKLFADTGVGVNFDEITFANDYLDDIRRYFGTELTSQLQRDVAQIERRLSDFSLEVFMTERSTNDPIQAHMSALIDTRENMKFYFKDRSGRRNLSQKFVRATTRQALLTAAIELYAIGASLIGDHMEVVHFEGSAKANGIKIGFRREQGFPLLSDVRDEIFHPNSNAFLKVVL
jgi:hypothetical protein